MSQFNSSGSGSGRWRSWWYPPTLLFLLSSSLSIVFGWGVLETTTIRELRNTSLGPVDLNYSTLDPSNVWWDDVIQIGGLLTYGMNYDVNKLFTTPTYWSILGWKYWEYRVNTRNPPGLLVNNKTYAINVTIINIGYVIATDVTTQTELACNGSYGINFNLFFGPYTTTRIVAAAKITERYGRVLMGLWAATEDAFKCGATYNEWFNRPPCTGPGNRRFPHLWGLIPLGVTYWENLINLLKVKGAKTVGFWAVYDPFVVTVAQGAETTAIGLGLTVVSTTMYNTNYTINPFVLYDKNSLPQAKQYDQLIAAFQALSPDAVVSAIRTPNSCFDWISAVKRNSYAPKVITTMLCSKEIASLGNDARYFVDFSIWEKELHGLGYDDQRDFKGAGSALTFYNDFLNYWGIPPVGYTALAYHTGYAIEAALEIARSIDHEKMNSAFPYVYEPSFAGYIGFNGYGINDKKTYAIVQYNQKQELTIVSPLAAATADMISPFVSWGSRDFKSQFLGFGVEIAMFIIFLICIILSVVCFVMLRLHWKDKSIVASSPIFLSIMLLGGSILYSAVPTWMLYTDVPSCHLRLWFLNIGFTLLFGTLVAKTFRVRQLFLVRNKMRVMKFSNKKVFMIVLVLVAIDVVLLTLWSAITGHEVQKVVLTGIAEKDGNLWENLNYNECSYKLHQAHLAFLILEGIYKCLMIIAGVYLSASLWKYGNVMWSESKQMLFAIYNIITFSVIGVALQLSLQGDGTFSTRSVLFVTRSMCIFLGGVVTVGAILFPRLMDPTGESRVSKESAGSTRTAAETSLALNDMEHKLETLENKYKLLKKKYREAVPSAEISDDVVAS